MKPSNAKNKKMLEVIFAGASIVVTIGVLIAATASYANYRTKMGLSPFGGMNDELTLTLASKQEVNAINSELTIIKQEQARLNDKIDSLSNNASPNTLELEVVGLRSSVSDMNQRLTKIEDVIVQDSQKALEIPMLRKDLDNVVSTTDLQIALLRQDIERIYSLMLATIVALTITVLASGLGSVLKKDDKNKGKE